MRREIAAVIGAVTGVGIGAVIGAGIGIVAMVAAPVAAAETVRGIARIDGVDHAIELRTGEGIGEIRYRPLADTGSWSSLSLDTLGPVLSVLGDTRLALLHDAITRWAGDDLTRLRDAMIARTRLAWERGRAGAKSAQPSQGAVRTRVRALLQYAVALREAGRWPEAITILRQERDANPLKSDWDRSEWSSVSAALASAMTEQGLPEAAVTVLDETAARLAASPWAINAGLQAAATLAQSGRYAEALRHVDQADRAFAQVAGGASVVPGATLQFDTVRACALHGLGRADEAAAIMARVATAASPRSRRYAPPPNRDLEERTAICMKDPAALQQLWRRDLDHPSIGSLTFVVAQPGFHARPYDEATLDKARAAFDAPPPMRRLPARYTPALNSWQ